MQQSLRNKLINEVRLLLGGGLVRIELTPDHYNLALDVALDRYRLRSPNSVEERFAFLELQMDEAEYILPNEIQEVRQIYRRTVTGTGSGTGANFDPFGAAFTNQITLGMGNGSGSLITYDLFAGYQKVIGVMFGLYVNFTWNHVSKMLTVHRKITANETVLLWVYLFRPEESLLQDQYARPWLRDYTLAKCKFMIGEVRSKFSNLPSPTGGGALNGDAIKNEAVAIMDNLEKEISLQTDSNIGYGIVIG